MRHPTSPVVQPEHPAWKPGGFALLQARLLAVLVIAMATLAAAAVAPVAGASASQLVIGPSSASLAGGKARLTASALRRQASTYAGNYQLKVTRYVFKNETGTLLMGVSEASLQRLGKGMPVESPARP